MKGTACGFISCKHSLKAQKEVTISLDVQTIFWIEKLQRATS
jgi:hypothetical protein